MTRANLRRARPIVREYCRELGIPYHETSIPRAYLDLLRFLHRVGEPLRTRTRQLTRLDESGGRPHA
jgi:hypothetical protein